MFTTILKFCGLVFLIALGLHYNIIQNTMIFAADAFQHFDDLAPVVGLVGRENSSEQLQTDTQRLTCALVARRRTFDGSLQILRPR